MKIQYLIIVIGWAISLNGLADSMSLLPKTKSSGELPFSTEFLKAPLGIFSHNQPISSAELVYPTQVWKRHLYQIPHLTILKDPNFERESAAVIPFILKSNKWSFRHLNTATYKGFPIAITLIQTHNHQKVIQVFGQYFNKANRILRRPMLPVSQNVKFILPGPQLKYLYALSAKAVVSEIKCQFSWESINSLSEEKNLVAKLKLLEKKLPIINYNLNRHGRILGVVNFDRQNQSALLWTQNQKNEQKLIGLNLSYWGKNLKIDPSIEITIPAAKQVLRRPTSNVVYLLSTDGRHYHYIRPQDLTAPKLEANRKRPFNLTAGEKVVSIGFEVNAKNGHALVQKSYKFDLRMIQL